MAWLKHHGIKGQKWGDRNGPPYPLDAEDHSAAEKKAQKVSGKNLAGDTPDNKSKKNGLSDGQKKALKIGAIAAVSALAVVGGVALAKSGKLDNLIKIGHNVTGVKKLAGEIPEGFDASFRDKADKILKNNPPRKAIAEAVENANKIPSDKNRNTCTQSSIAGILRSQFGLPVEAIPTTGEQQDLAGMIQSCFKGYSGYGVDNPAIASIFGSNLEKSGRQRTSEFLKTKFGNNASGVLSVQWNPKIGGGHAWSWRIIDGEVSFFDCKGHLANNSSTLNNFWKMVNSKDAMTIARLDTITEINWQELIKYGVKLSQ